MTINKALKTVRVYHGLNQTELAQRLNVPKSTISEIESGKRGVDLTMVSRYTDFFKIPASSLILLAEMQNDPANKSKDPRKWIAEKVFKILDWIDETSAVTK